jgi:hypothetical protein
MKGTRSKRGREKGNKETRQDGTSKCRQTEEGKSIEVNTETGRYVKSNG